MVAHKMLAGGLELKGDDSGAFVATIATLGVVDRDADVTFPGAFAIGKAIPISSYGHGSWNGALPVGRGVLNADATHAWVDGKFFTNTAAGADTYRTVKGLGGLAQWSYGYDVVLGITSTDPRMKAYPSARRGLVSVNVHEVSPVLVGAGIGTATTAIKSATSPDIAETYRAYLQVKSQLGTSAPSPSSRVHEYELAASDVPPSIVAFAQKEARRSAAELRIDAPRVRFFSGAGGHAMKSGDALHGELLGRADHATGTVWVRGDLSAAHTIETVAHETGHVGGLGEFMAEHFGNRALRAAIAAEMEATRCA